MLSAPTNLAVRAAGQIPQTKQHKDDGEPIQADPNELPDFRSNR